jgi:multidrug resistance efflux pump
MSFSNTRYTPIKTPIRRRLDFVRLRVVPAVVFLAVGMIVVLLWTDRVQSPTFVGWAEGISAPITAPETGFIRSVYVDRFDEVRAGDALFTIELTDSALVSARIAVLSSQIDLLRSGLDPISDWQRNRINFAGLRTDQMEEQIAISALKLRELQQERTLERFQKLVETGGATMQEAEDARLELDLIRDELKLRLGHAERIAELIDQIDRTDARFSESGNDDPVAAAVQVLEREMEALEKEFMPITVFAPIDGIVSAVYFASNSYLPRGEIMMIVEDPQVRYLTGFIRQPLTVRPRVGDEVQVMLRTQDRTIITGVIDRIGGRMQLIDPVLQRPGLTNESGLPMRIRLPLDGDWPLFPGEIVDVGLER